MKAYEIYRDFSDEYDQDYEIFGYYLDHEKATNRLKTIIKEREGEIGSNIYGHERNWHYDVPYIGHYGMSEINIIE